VVRVLGELGRVYCGGTGKVPGGYKGCCFRDFAEGLKTLRKRLGFGGGGGKNIICVPTHTPNFPLANRSTDWQSGQPFGIQVNLLANGKIWHMDQPTSQLGNLVYGSAYWQCGQLVYQVHNANSFHQITSIHSQPTAQSILPSAPAYAIPLSLLLYFVLQQLYWFSFLH